MEEDTPLVTRRPCFTEQDFVYVSLLCIGAGFLFPYNSFITALDYFTQEFPSKDPEFVFSAAYMYALLVSMALHVYFSYRDRSSTYILQEPADQPRSRNRDPARRGLLWRCRIGFSALLLSVLLPPVYLAAGWSAAFEAITGATVVCGLGNGLLQSSIYGIAGSLTVRFTSAVMVGESVAGVIVALNRIITKAAYEKDGSEPVSRDGAFTFFYISLAIVSIAFILFEATMRSSFVRHRLKRQITADVTVPVHVPVLSEGEEQTSDQHTVSKRLDPGNLALDAMAEHVTSHPENTANVHTTTTETRFDEPMASSQQYANGDDTEEPFTPSAQSVPVEDELSDSDLPGVTVLTTLGLLKLIRLPAISVFMTFCLSLLVFPGVIVSIKSGRLGTWMPVLLISLFNLSDLLGKISCTWPVHWKRVRLLRNPGVILALVLLRAVLCVLVTLCALPRQHPVLRHEVFGCLLTFAIGLSNGFLASICMQTGPERVPLFYREKAGNYMTLALIGGLTAGATAAFAYMPVL